MKIIRFSAAMLALIMLLPLFTAAAEAGSDVIYLSDLDGVSHVLISSQGISNGINQGLQQKRMSVGGRSFRKGFCTHPVDGDTPSVITVDVSAYSTEYPLFHTVMGKDDITEDGGPGHTVVFIIEVDGKAVYMSDQVDIGDMIELYLDVSGAKEIKLMCYAATVFAWLTCDFGDTYLCKSTVKEIRLAKAPIKKEYFAGEKLSCVGGIIETEYENGAVVQTYIDESMISGFDTNKAGSQQITVTFKDAVFTYDIKVTDKNAPETQPVTEAETEPLTEAGTKAEEKTGEQTEKVTEAANERQGSNTWIIPVIIAVAAAAAVCVIIAVIKKKRGQTGRTI